MIDNYGNLIATKLGSYIFSHKDSFENEEFYKISWIEEEDIDYSVIGTTFRDLQDDYIEIRTTVEAQVQFSGYSKYGPDTGGDTKYYNVFFKALLNDGLHDVEVTHISEYTKAAFNKDKTLSQSWLSYMKEDKMDDYAEDFLSRNYKEPLYSIIPVDPVKVVNEMGLKMYYAPLGDSIFGKTYFGEEKVTVYRGVKNKDIVEIVTSPGTILINPDVYFMRNIGTANNTIIHECVHWDRHRKAFELLSLLQGGSKHISCEIVECEYKGIGSDESTLKWMEWQANQLAPRILMPKKTTKRIYAEYLQKIQQSDPDKRYAEILQEVVWKVAEFFSVSHLSAKLRLIELGYNEVEGTCVYCDGMALPPYSFQKDKIDKNHSYVIDEVNLIRNVCVNHKLMELFAKGVIVYANCMLCFNDPKYVELNENNQYILTDYALEHVDECCFLFKRKYSANDNYSDTYYRRCFLCREIDADEFVPIEYDPQHIINQSKEEMQEEINAILDMINDELVDAHENMKGGFAGALDFLIKKYGVSEYQLQERTGITVQSISKYRNTFDPNMEKGTVLALCKGLYLLPHDAFYLLDMADIKLTNLTPSNIFVRHLITNHMDDTWAQWVEKLFMSGISKDWIPRINSIVKEVKIEMGIK